MRLEPKDINGKTSESRKFLRKYAPLSIFVTLAICVYSVILDQAIDENVAYILVWLNGIIIGLPLGKMGAEHIKGRK